MKAIEKSKMKKMMLGCLPIVTACLLQLAILPKVQAQALQEPDTETEPDTMTTTLFEGARLIVGDGSHQLKTPPLLSIAAGLPKSEGKARFRRLLARPPLI